MFVLGIESSCDECAVAVVENGTRLVAQRVASQIALHAPYGGVVPELASRDHIRKIIPVLEQALEEAGLAPEQLDGFGVSAGPGLIGSLLIGVTAAKTLAYRFRKPLIGVNHLEAHLHAIHLESQAGNYPCLGLVVSGGHTSLFRIDGLGSLKLIGRTLDDAAGEAFDKAAKLLGLGYPGGVAIQAAAHGGNQKGVRFPRPMRKPGLDFSFSGLKTAVAVAIKTQGVPSGLALSDFAASFQEVVVDSLVQKVLRAAQQERLSRVVIAGGVASNHRLREEMLRRGGEAGLEVAFPSVPLCTDNAAMVAALAGAYLVRGQKEDIDDGLGLDADAGLGWKNA